MRRCVMSYFIINKTSWRFSAQEFSERVSAQWPRAQVTKLPDAKYNDALEFEFPMSESTLYGSLNRKCNAVSFHVGLRDCAEFARWCRSLIPPSEEVIFCDESMSINFVLRPDMVPAEIVQAIEDS
jgi:hypothetical protein